MSQAVGPRGPRIYNLFPLLFGPVAQWIKHVPRIAGMGFNWIYLNPFHYPGFSGSLYAVKDYHRLNPLFRGSSYERDDDLLKDFTDCAATRGMSVMMDLVINHTSKDSPLADRHPTWYVRDDDGGLVSPGTIDPNDPTQRTEWGDLAELDWSLRPEREEMIRHFSDIVAHYVRLGFRGFRCDAAYQVPAEVWRRIIDAAHQVGPDTLFFAETLGCTPDEVTALRPARFDFLFNSSKWWDFRQPWLLEQYEMYRHVAPSVAFPETHDTDRLISDLAADGMTDPRAVEAAYKRRYLFAAAFSSAVMMPAGFEYGFRKAVNVVNSRPSDWERPAFDISGFVAAVNRMKAEHSVLNHEGPQRLMSSETGVIGLLRHNDVDADWVLTVINPTDNGAWSLETDGGDEIGTIAAKGREVTPERPGPTFDSTGGLFVTPGEVRVFVGDAPL